MSRVPSSVPIGQVLASDMGLYRACGAYISLWRRLNGKSNKELADMVGCLRGVLWRLQTGKPVRVSLSFLSRVAIATGADLLTMVLEGAAILEAEKQKGAG